MAPIIAPVGAMIGDRESEREPGAHPDEGEEREHADDQTIERWKRTQHEPLLESRSDDA